MRCRMRNSRTRVDAATVFARLTPQQKARVIRALRANGHVVGYLGDGINDSPALTAADVGISVDTAADVAKESADIILLEKSLLVLNDGVLRGPPGVRQRHQVPAHGGKLQFRQHVQHDRRERAAAVPADGAGADSRQQPAVRRVADGACRRTTSTPTFSPGRDAGTSAASGATWSASDRCRRCSTT